MKHVRAGLREGHQGHWNGKSARHGLRRAEGVELDERGVTDCHCSKRSNCVAAITVIPNIKWDMTLVGVRTHTFVPPWLSFSRALRVLPGCAP